MLRDTFAEAAKAAGMTYAQYARHRLKLARKRCGIGARPKASHQANNDNVSTMVPPKSETPSPSERDCLRAIQSVFPPPDLPQPIDPIDLLRVEARRLRSNPAYLSIQGDDPEDTLPAHSPIQPLGLIAQEVCEHWGITLSTLRGRRRCRFISYARAHFCYRARTERELSWSQIGSYLDKDHTSCLHGYHRYIELAQRKASGERFRHCEKFPIYEELANVA